MSNLDIETLSVAPVIRRALNDLSDTIRIEKYSPKGSNGHVFFGFNTVNRRKIALKFYYWGGENKYHAEPRYLASINSPYVIEIYRADVLDDDWSLFSTPYCESGDIDDLLSRGTLPIKRVMKLLMNVLNGVGVLHSNQIIHSDLKPENILINDNGIAQIGDFGSVKIIPEDENSVPGSGHSILFRPPESCESGRYGFEGDLYQCGVLLFKMLGGFLPYKDIEWLNDRQLNKYDQKTDPVDRNIFVDSILKNKIVKGKLLDVHKLPYWVPDNVKRVIRKACRVETERRYSKVSQFMVDLHTVNSSLADWYFKDGAPRLKSNGREYRLSNKNSDLFIVEKNIGNGWRKDPKFSPNTKEALIKELNEMD